MNLEKMSCTTRKWRLVTLTNFIKVLYLLPLLILHLSATGQGKLWYPEWDIPLRFDYYNLKESELSTYAYINDHAIYSYLGQVIDSTEYDKIKSFRVYDEVYLQYVPYMTSLETLTYYANKRVQLNTYIKNINNLKHLSINSNVILPEGLKNQDLLTLFIDANLSYSIPKFVYKQKNIKALHIMGAYRLKYNMHKLLRLKRLKALYWENRKFDKRVFKFDSLEYLYYGTSTSFQLDERFLKWSNMKFIGGQFDLLNAQNIRILNKIHQLEAIKAYISSTKKEELLKLQTLKPINELLIHIPNREFTDEEKERIQKALPKTSIYFL